MSLIPGSIPVTGFIAPTDTTDTYAVTDAIYGIDGLRNVSDYIERDNISLERRREGMIVGVISDSTYWKLSASTGSNTWSVGSASNWNEFAIFGGDGVGASIKYFIPSDDKIIVATNSQYWVYGDLTIEGELENHGQVIIANGGLILNGGTFSGMTGSLAFVSFETGLTTSYATSSTISFTVENSIFGVTISSNILTNSITASLLSTVGGGATSGYLLTNDGLGNFNWVLPNVGDITGVTAGLGLSGGGSSGNLVLDINTINGLSIISNSVGLGGTLSNNTSIYGGDLYSLSITSPYNFISTKNQDSFLSINSDNGYDGGFSAELTIASGNTTSTIFLDRTRNESKFQVGSSASTFRMNGSSNTFIDDINLRGIEYSSDYTSNFTTHSLITKGYLESNTFNGTGSSNYITRWITSTELGTGSIYDSGTAVGIGTQSDGSYMVNINGDVNILGTLYATSKSFEITHPLNSSKRLTYGSLEGPEYGVYVRGKLDNEHIIELPDYWIELVDESSITVSLTPFGIYQNLFIEKVENNKVYVGSGNSGLASCYYIVYAERKDIPKIIVEK